MLPSVALQRHSDRAEVELPALRRPTALGGRVRSCAVQLAVALCVALAFVISVSALTARFYAG